MLSETPEERPNCSELLAKTHEWILDSNIVRNDEYFEQFIQFTESNENFKIFKTILEN